MKYLALLVGGFKKASYLPRDLAVAKTEFPQWVAAYSTSKIQLVETAVGEPQQVLLSYSPPAWELDLRSHFSPTLSHLSAHDLDYLNNPIQAYGTPRFFSSAENSPRAERPATYRERALAHRALLKLRSGSSSTRELTRDEWQAMTKYYNPSDADPDSPAPPSPT